MVQARWGHINQDYSLLTKIQAILLDGHFVLEHGGRNRGGRFFNFNGTAGVWRRTAIDDAGGWQHDTLTEDLDLSYRAQLRGWRFVFVPDVIAPAEVPVEMNAFKSQQHRWAKGSIQTCRKLLPRILRSDLPFGVKAEAFFHLTANFNYTLMCILSILMFPSMVIRYNMGWYEMLLIDVPLFFAATFSFCNFYMVCQREMHKDWLVAAEVRPVPDVGRHRPVDQQHARGARSAVQQADANSPGRPKYRIEGDSDEWVGKRYRQSVAVQPLVELALGLYFTCDGVLRAGQPDLRHGAVPGPVPGRVPLYRAALGRPAVRRRPGRAQDPGRRVGSKVNRRHSPGRRADSILSDIDRLVDLAGVSAALAAGQDDDSQGQHLLALSVSGGEHDAVAARRDDPGAGAARASPIRSASRTRRS